MAAAAIKIASAAQGDNAKKKKPSHSATHPEDEEKQAERELKKIEETLFPTTGILKYQKQARDFYTKPTVEYFVAFLIVANFITNIMERWKDPVYSARGLVDCTDDEIEAGWCAKMRFQESVWWGFGLFYNIMFTGELVINFYAYAPFEFWKSGWNKFDFVVVLVGVLSYMPFELPGPLSLLRLMRAFRVFRLFKRVKSLNKIIVSLAKAIPGVMNAFLIMLIVMCIYAILGVEFFKYEGTRCIQHMLAAGVPEEEMGRINSGYDFEDDCLITGHGDDMLPYPDYTATFGKIYFGNFMRSLYTLFQVLTGDSWSEAIGRPLMELEPWSASYFISFILVNGVVLINVVVAVLLEKMVDEPEPDPDDESAEPEELTTEDRLDMLEESTAHITLMLKKLLEAQHIPIPPGPKPRAVALPKPAPAEETTETDIVTTMPHDSGGGPSRVDYYTEPKDAGLLEIADVSSPRTGADDGEGTGTVSMQLMGC